MNALIKWLRHDKVMGTLLLLPPWLIALQFAIFAVAFTYTSILRSRPQYHVAAILVFVCLVLINYLVYRYHRKTEESLTRIAVFTTIGFSPVLFYVLVRTYMTMNYVYSLVILTVVFALNWVFLRRKFQTRAILKSVLLRFVVSFVLLLLTAVTGVYFYMKAHHADDYFEGDKETATLPALPTDGRRVQIPAGNSYPALLRRYSPVFVQQICRRPVFDYLVGLDFDGDLNGRNNVRNCNMQKCDYALPASVYGEVTAESSDAWYLTYLVYHIRDYDTPLRETVFESASHDNDIEGIHLRVDKKTQRVTHSETWYHVRFLTFAAQPQQSTGTEQVMGRIHFEDETHPVTFVQCEGHGVRMMQSYDWDMIEQNRTITYRYGENPGNHPHPAKWDSKDNVKRYQIKSMDPFYANARGPFEDAKGTSMFQHSIIIPGTDTKIGLFYSGDFFGGEWARPKPPWSWDDAWDDIPVTAFHFHPAYSINSHIGTTFSEEYTYNRPLSEFWHKPSIEFSKVLGERSQNKNPIPVRGREGKRYFNKKNHQLQGFHHYVKKIFRDMVSRFVMGFG